MRNTKTLVECQNPYWVIRIPKPTRGTVRWLACLALSVGFNVGFLAEAWADQPGDEFEQFDDSAYLSPSEECEAYAALHYEMADQSDAAWEAAIALCGERIGTYEQARYWSMQCEETGWSTTVEVDGTTMHQAHCGDSDGIEVY